MIKLMKTILSKIWWLGRGTATMMGVVVMLALTVGLASTALAGTGIGAPFHLGKTNTVNAITRLVGSVTGSSLLIDNNSSATTATALDLQVQPGKDPMKINSQAKVDNLNADKVDGKSVGAFVSNIYIVTESVNGPGGGSREFITVFCDPGDRALGGSGNGSFVGGVDMESSGLFDSSYIVGLRDDGDPEQISARVTCADFPPLR